jgi:glucose dehydrogenase
MRRLLLLAVTTVVVAATTVALAAASRTAPHKSSVAENPYSWLPAGVSGILGPAEADFPQGGGDIANTRFSLAKEITTSNVKNLKIAWETTWPVGNQTLESMEQQAIVVSGKGKNLPLETGTMFISTFLGLRAMDPTTGKILWDYVGPPQTGTGLAGRPDRTQSFGQGLVFTGQQDRSVVAVNAKTGAPVWTAQVQSAGIYPGLTGFNAEFVTRYYDDGKDGVVLSGFTGAESPVRGHLDALNAKTGKLMWRFWTTPDPAQVPAILTWGNPAEAAVGGGSVWSIPGVDPELGLVYFGVGNCYPELGRQPGKNLWCDSIVALNWKTGQLKWYYQMVHHDEWDYDSPNPVIRANVKIDGKLVPVIMHGNKNGYLFVLKAANGGPVPHFAIPEVPVPDLNGGKGLANNNNWPTQPIPQGAAGQITPHCATEAEAKLKIPGYPTAPNGKPIIPTCFAASPWIDAYYLWGGGTGSGGGIGWPPMSYSPLTNMLYICSQTEYLAVSLVAAGSPQQQSISSGPRGAAVPGEGGAVTAIDMGTNTIAWKKSYQGSTDRDCYTGVLSTAGNLVFVPSNGNTYTAPFFGGKLYAYNARTGEELWSYQNPVVPGATAGAGVIQAPPTTYMVRGKQYVAQNMIGRGSDGALNNRLVVFTL